MARHPRATDDTNTFVTTTCREISAVLKTRLLVLNERAGEANHAPPSAAREEALLQVALCMHGIATHFAVAFGQMAVLAHMDVEMAMDLMLSSLAEAYEDEVTFEKVPVGRSAVQ